MNNQYGGNQFGFNDPNQYNQYNQQPVDPNMQQQMYNQQMYNQQPMMDPYQNQYPNQYNPYMYNQPPRRGGGFGILGILIALILLAGLVLFLLDYTGTVDVKGWFVKDKTEEKEPEKTTDEPKEEPKQETPEEPVIDYREETAALCKKVDAQGNYNLAEMEAKNSQTKQLPDSAATDEAWKIVSGLQYCQENLCYNYQPGTDHRIHFYQCTTNQYSSTTLEEALAQAKREVVLQTACSTVDANGNFTMDGITCTSFVCNYTENGKTYTKNCKE